MKNVLVVYIFGAERAVAPAWESRDVKESFTGKGKNIPVSFKQ